MKQKNILILVVIIIIIVLGTVLALRKDIVVPVVFEPDETIMADFCRRAITRAQLAKITGYDEGGFVFEDIEEKVPEIGLIKTCDIRLEEVKIRPKIKIGFFPLDVEYKAMKEKLTEFMPPRMEVKEIEGIGEKAFSVSMDRIPDLEMPMDFPEFRQIIFLDADINQVIGVAIGNLSYEILIELTKQIEKNLK